MTDKEFDDVVEGANRTCLLVHGKTLCQLIEEGERDFFSYGIIALDCQNEILHFCGYSSQPTEEDFKSLEQDLRTNHQMGLVGREFVLAVASQSVLEEYRKIYYESQKDQKAKGE